VAFHDLSELRAFYAYVIPRPKELQARRAAIDDVQHALRTNVRGWQDITLAVFGSYALDCRPAHIFSSDLDLEVVGAPGLVGTGHTPAAGTATTPSGGGGKGEKKRSQLAKAQAVAQVGNTLRRSQCCTGMVLVRVAPMHVFALLRHPPFPTLSPSLPSPPPPPHTHT
jgi:hypothetical protein